MVAALDPTWESWFEGGDFARGLGYFNDGRVKLRDADAGGWSALVDGFERYSVYLACDERGYASPGADMTSCTCPRFADGYLCKHIAATCAAVEAADISSFERKQRGGDEAIGLVDAVSAEECKSFLKVVLQSDAKWAREFSNRFGEIDVGRAADDLADDIEDIVDAHSPYGFVGWNESLSCEFAILGAIAQAIDPFMDKGRYDEAFDLTLEALSLLRSVEVDDSNGFYSSTADKCMGYWRRIADAGPEGSLMVARRAVAFCLETEEADPERAEILSYQVDDAESFIVERFADVPLVSDSVMILARERMRDKADPSELFYESRERARAHWMTVCLRAMKAAGRSLDECVEVASPLAGHAAVVRLLVACAQEIGDAKRAIDLLETGRATAATQGDAAQMLEQLLPCVPSMHTSLTGESPERARQREAHSQAQGCPPRGGI